MSEILAEIKACHEKNASIFSKLEALQQVRTTYTSLKCTGVDPSDFEDVKHDRVCPEVIEFTTVEDGVAFRDGWKFQETFRQDLEKCIGGLDWSASSWKAIKKLNVDIKE